MAYFTVKLTDKVEVLGKTTKDTANTDVRRAFAAEQDKHNGLGLIDIQPTYIEDEIITKTARLPDGQEVSFTTFDTDTLNIFK